MAVAELDVERQAGRDPGRARDHAFGPAHHGEAALQDVRVGGALQHALQRFQRLPAVDQETRPFEQRRQARRRAFQALAGERQLTPRIGQARAQIGEALAAPGHERRHRVGEALGPVVEALAHLADQPRRVGQAAAQALDQGAPLLEPALAGRAQAPVRLQDLVHQLAAHRDRHLGRGRGRRRAPIGGEVDERGVGLVPDPGDEGDLGLGGGAHDDLFVEGPEVLDAAAAARDDQQIGPRHGTLGRQTVEAADRGGDLLGRALALDQHRPNEHPAREAVGQAVQDVADDRAGGRGDHADDLGQERQRPLAFLGEQPLGRELALALFEQLEQCALAGELHPLDHDLVARAAGIGRDPAARDHLHAVLGRDPEASGGAAPAHRVQDRVLVLEREIEVAGGGALEARDLAAHADELEAALERPLDRLGDLRDRNDRQVGAGARGIGIGG